MDEPSAINRLGTYGVRAIAASSTSSAVIVAKCVQNFVTAIIDSLKLNMATVDQVHPLLPDLVTSPDKLGILPPDCEGKTKMKEWVSRLSNMEFQHEHERSRKRGRWRGFKVKMEEWRLKVDK
ncbi:hypothetical protein Gohar_000686 [Gossypium harknessii]|uniref:VPS28 C-terminal domain-containing protein n=1 Tax=Gossypium harknessii TaxID=34285 RepID=A0A7J9I314_9ROSI|nr:hypothetical protein [Gossypium harknessii]